MKKIILFIKTYQKDFERVRFLLSSIEKHNVDKIPVLLSVNDSDFDFFKDRVNVQVIKDSEIILCNEPNGWKYQQVVKSQLHRIDICENYVCIDSDSYFIKDFKISDFMFDENIPYTVLHQQKELFFWSSINQKTIGYNPKKEFEKDRNIIMKTFGRRGVFYDFGPSPVIWSNKVWKSLNDNYLVPNKLSFQNLIELCPSEFSWYGEWLLKDKTIPIYPLEPLFKVFHYEKQFKDDMNQGHTEKTIRENYLGILKQSNWNFSRRWYEKILKL